MSSTAQRFGEIVAARRHELDLNQLELWAAGGPSNTTLTVIENGRLETLTRTTARKLDQGLQWEPGSARRVWDGGEPAPLLADVSPEHSAHLRDAILGSDLEPADREAILKLLDSA